MILETCRVRGIALSDAQHARVASETDAAVLSTWSERAFEATSADALLA